MTTQGIESGELRGTDLSLFKSSFVGKLKRSEDLPAIRAALEHLRTGQAKLKELIFTDRHKVWSLGAERELTTPPLPSEQSIELVASYEGAKIVCNHEAERVQILFDGKPSAEIRTALKKEGWRWSPTNEAWQRKNTLNAVASARSIVSRFFSSESLQEVTSC